jgi:hypothetical protein
MTKTRAQQASSQVATARRLLWAGVLIGRHILPVLRGDGGPIEPRFTRVRHRTDLCTPFTDDRDLLPYEAIMNGLPKYQRYLAVTAIGCAALASACASTPAPTEQMAVSRSAISNAVSAGGAEHAAVEMTSAHEKMSRANLAMAKEDYDTARRLAEEAQADARLAEKKAHSEKARTAANVMQDDIRVLREEINRKSK